jgi:hypothetical protein
MSMNLLLELPKTNLIFYLEKQNLIDFLRVPVRGIEIPAKFSAEIGRIPESQHRVPALYMHNENELKISDLVIDLIEKNCYLNY